MYAKIAFKDSWCEGEQGNVSLLSVVPTNNGREEKVYFNELEVCAYTSYMCNTVFNLWEVLSPHVVSLQ